jgi:hypothetical protein
VDSAWEQKKLKEQNFTVYISSTFLQFLKRKKSLLHFQHRALIIGVPNQKINRFANLRPRWV